MSNNKKTYIHPEYNHAYARYDLDMDDVIRGLEEQGYNFSGGNNSDSNGNGSNNGSDSNSSSTIDKSNYRLEVLSTNGTRCNDPKFSTILFPRLYKDNVDITEETPASYFKWIRITGNSEASRKEDAEWNLRFAAGTKECPITKEDIKRSTCFRCEFVLPQEDNDYVYQAYEAYIKNK